MTDKERQALALRVIVVSTRAAWRHTPTEELESLRARSDKLLATLEERVIGDGGDPTVLADIERARHRLWEGVEPYFATSRMR